MTLRDQKDQEKGEEGVEQRQTENEIKKKESGKEKKRNVGRKKQSRRKHRLTATADAFLYGMKRTQNK